MKQYKRKMKYLFNAVLGFYIIAYNRLQSVLTRLLGREALIPQPKPIQGLKAGVKVKSRTGVTGIVYKTYRNKQNELVACTVVWEKPYKGDLITMLIAVDDLLPFEA